MTIFQNSCKKKYLFPFVPIIKEEKKLFVNNKNTVKTNHTLVQKPK